MVSKLPLCKMVIQRIEGGFAERKKEKNAITDNNLPHGVDMVERMRWENVIDVKVSRATSFSKDITVHDGEEVTDTNVSVTVSRRGYKERFWDIARQNAFRFAHFSSQAEQDVDVTNEAAEEMGSEEKEDWPSPFATAMKIIRDRETNIKHQQQISSSERSKIGQFGLLWVPKKDQRCQSRKLAVPSLQDLCMTILVKNADVITSLDSVPDVLRHKICQSLCDSRKMTNQFFELLARGSPTEIRIRDCSWTNMYMRGFCQRA